MIFLIIISVLLKIFVQKIVNFSTAFSGANPFNVTKIEKTKPDGLNLHINQKLTKNRTFIVHLKFDGIKPQNSSTNNSIYLLNATNETTTTVPT